MKKRIRAGGETIKQEFKSGGAIALIVVVIACFLCVSATFVNSAKKDMDVQSMQYLNEISEQKATLIHNYLEKDLNLLTTVGNLLGGQEELSLVEMIPALKIISEQNGFKRMAIIHPDGITETTDDLNFYIGDRAFFISAMRGVSSVSDRLVDRIDETDINVVAAPIVRGGEVIGVVYATNSTKVYSEMLNLSSFGGAGYSYFITSMGEPVVDCLHPDSLGIFENFFTEMRKTNIDKEVLNKVYADIQQGENGVFNHIRNGVKRSISYTKIGINDWYILSVVPSNAISISSDTLVLRLIVASLIIFALIIVLVYLILNNMKNNTREFEKILLVDALTGIPSSTKFVSTAPIVIKQSGNLKHAIASIDISNFKAFNDIHGRTQGDLLIKEMANFICNNAREDEIFARVSADNFVWLINYTDKEFLIYLAESFTAYMKAFVVLSNIDLNFGFYEVVDKSLDVSTMIDRALLAKLSIKNNVDVNYAFFNDAIRDEVLRIKDIEDDMAGAIEKGEFVVYFQPKYEPYTETIVGAEALVRWIRPAKGIVMPGAFISIFERNGFIRKLDLYVFEQTCKILARMIRDKQVDNKFKISVNLSRVNLTNGDIIEILARIADEYEVPRGLLEIEITESTIMQYSNDKIFVEIVTAFKKTGFGVSMDDFGSGYSSLGMLADLPLDVVKLDRRFFVSGDYTDIVSGIIRIAKSLGMSVVAEGIEDRAHVDALILMGCDVIQGYYYAKPMPAADFLKLFEKDRSAIK